MNQGRKEESGSHAHARLGVLVVDDDRLLGGALSRLLTRFGYDARWVRTSEEAMDATAVRVFDCGVFDIRLGRDDGVVLADKLLRQGRVGVAVFFSGTTSELDRMRAERVGVLIPKEAQVESLMRAIRTAGSRSGTLVKRGW